MVKFQNIKKSSLLSVTFIIILGLMLVFVFGCARKSGVSKKSTEQPGQKQAQVTPTPSPEPSPIVEPVEPKEKPSEQTIPGDDAAKPPSTEPIPDIGAIYFAFDSYDLTDQARMTLSQNAQWLKQNTNLKIRVEGNCDERGTVEYNLALGEKRANVVKDYYISLGISANRIQTISYGKERPVDPSHTEDAWAKNRRSDTVKLSP